MMSWRQFLSTAVFFLLISNIAALEFSIESHYDTFDQTKKAGSLGFSFSLQEDLTNITFIDVKLLYKNAGQYAAYCKGNVKAGFMHFGGGIIYDIYHQTITPGLVTDMKIQLGKLISLGGIFFITFTPNNILQDYAQEGSAFITTQLVNAYFTSRYQYRHIKIDDNKKYSHGVNFEVIAYDFNSPINLGLNSTLTLFFDEANSDYFNLNMDVGAHFEIDTKKFGAYFIKAGANVFSFTAVTQTVPFNISIGARFYAE